MYVDVWRPATDERETWIVESRVRCLHPRESKKPKEPEEPEESSHRNLYDRVRPPAVDWTAFGDRSASDGSSTLQGVVGQRLVSRRRRHIVIIKHDQQTRLVLLQRRGGQLPLRPWTSHEATSPRRHPQPRSQLWPSQSHANLSTLSSHVSRHAALSQRRIHRVFAQSHSTEHSKSVFTILDNTGKPTFNVTEKHNGLRRRITIRNSRQRGHSYIV